MAEWREAASAELHEANERGARHIAAAIMGRFSPNQSTTMAATGTARRL